MSPARTACEYGPRGASARRLRRRPPSRSRSSHACHGGARQRGCADADLPRLPGQAPRRARRPRAAGPVRHAGLPRPLRRPDPAHLALRLGLHDRRRGGRAAPLDVGRAARAAERDGHRRHPLRHALVEAGHDLGGRLASTRCSTASRPRPSTRSRSATAATRPTCRSRTSPAARPGSPTATTASRSTPSTAGRRGCSCPTCTSGRAPSGCAACG